MLPIRLLSLLAILLVSSTPSWAGPTDPVTVSLPPTDQGDAFVPGVRLVADLPVPYVEEEFFVAGESTLFSYRHDPPLGPTDIEPIQEEVPYKTRIIVRRPADPKRFNGTVVIEWWNSTAGFDTAPAWDPSAAWFADAGVVYVGVTNSTTALDFLVGGCRLFGIRPPACGTRYASLFLPENGLAFEIMSQIASLLRSSHPDNPLPPEYAVERLFHVGESQQAGSVVTYASAFHVPGVNDGYFIQSGIRARPINFGPSCDDPASPPFPGCTPRLSGADALVRTDLPVPVYQVVTETDFEVLGFGTFGRQPDTDTFRYYEIAGAAHLTVHEGIEIIPPPPVSILLEDLCLNELNTTADGPVFASFVLDALWEALEEQVERGTPPPPSLWMDETAGVLDRDPFGNALGGVRLPSMEAPLATYVPMNVADPSLPPFLVFIGNLACFLGGSVLPFDAATLDDLYPSHGRYVNRVSRAANALVQQRLMRESDAAAVKRAAARSDVGKP